MSIHNVCFHTEIRKILSDKPAQLELHHNRKNHQQSECIVSSLMKAVAVS